MKLPKEKDKNLLTITSTGQYSQKYYVLQSNNGHRSCGGQMKHKH